MKKLTLTLLMLPCITLFSKNQSLNKWIMPDPSRHYHETVFLTAHNAYSNTANGYIQPQQFWDVKKQLEMGIRGLMLDTHYTKKKSVENKNKIVLCHRAYGLTKKILRPFKGEPETLHNSLEIIKDFLIKNPQEIVTVFLENYTQGHHLDEIIKASNIEDFILKPSDWNPEKKQGWPTLGWMQENNKRLVFFNQLGQTKYIYDEWSCHAENQWGALNYDDAIKERHESVAQNKKTRHLLVLNYFPKFYIQPLQKKNFNKINSEDLSTFFNYTLTNGLDHKSNYKKRYPNFIALDHINEGNGMKLVNKINLMANNEKTRKKMFYPLKN